MKIHKILAVMSVAVLAACSGATGGGSASPQAQTTTGSKTAIPAGLESFYGQKIEWKPCDDAEFMCATMEAPMDYSHPEGKKVTIPLEKAVGKNSKGNVLFVNPGGPGGSATELVEVSSLQFPKKLLDSYDIVGVEPRGVGKSMPVKCLDDKDMFEFLRTSYPLTPEGEKAQNEAVKKFADSCVKNTGESIKFVGTREAAQDLDLARHLLGSDKMNFLGFSYGTQLGGTYAELFPQNVNRMVLDGAVDPSLNGFNSYLAQLKGFEVATNNYLDWCLKGKDCPFTGDREQARQKIIDLFAKTEHKPIPTDHEPLTQAALTIGYITPLYSSESWPLLSRAFNEVFTENKGTLFDAFFRSYAGLNAKGEFTNNMMVANTAISCADTQVEGDPATWRKQSEIAAKEAPILGPTMPYSEYQCQVIPKSGAKIVDNFKAKGSAPIVVVGTVGDPATPYGWAEKFAKGLDNGVLLTYEGDGHTAYPRGGKCIEDAVNAYLLDGKVPENGKRCAA
ncbi:pimeloyl-ACP methyl ester carboxylesterase [Arcanobacterium wilhelmae]|uniref:Pimeloyl-ACP methyl ester carboxylesterase n=1 Tax=Arcanobacterium wilhelmae TaxID=1803177 RepID=A0ABT9NBK8_9ACTO|nr:alpha/beta hydrolase [Arcanobacterium wilhelmae]MDP9801099.1 pimeloyl-ACP methyl ester carboxylesterase [Arcanobacterium wilhelmae]WFN90453.1 alpha/beta hydrolase [Arcanobacterium wilhelmae]